MSRSRPVLTGAALALLAPAATAHAATLTTAPCVVESQPMTIQGAGWGPGSAWSVQTTDAQNQIYDYGTADAAGAFTSTAERAPIVVGDTLRPVTFTLTGQQDGQDVASTTFQVVDFLVQPKKPSGKPTGKTRWRFSGFAPGKPIYVHVRRKGKTRTQRAGVGSSPCGTLSKRLRRLPAWPKRKIRDGTYKVAIDNRRRYKRTNGSYPQYTARITVS